MIGTPDAESKSPRWYAFLIKKFGSKLERSADPYRDTDVIDARAPRFNQAVIGGLAAVALVTGWWWLLAILALQLILGLTLGRRWCLPCVTYYEVVQPRFREGPLQDSRPPRFANMIGAVVLSAATLAHLAGLSLLGWILGGLVAVLALLAASTGLCVGCEFYRIGAHLRGSPLSPARARSTPDDFEGVNGSDFVLEFTHPLCSECNALERKLRDEGRDVVTVDVRSRPDLARKYGVVVVPTAVAVASGGVVAARLGRLNIRAPVGCSLCASCC